MSSTKNYQMLLQMPSFYILVARNLDQHVLLFVWSHEQQQAHRRASWPAAAGGMPAHILTPGLETLHFSSGCSSAKR